MIDRLLAIGSSTNSYSEPNLCRIARRLPMPSSDKEKARPWFLMGKAGLKSQEQIVLICCKYTGPLMRREWGGSHGFL
jgi:hypothetical protein